MKNYFAVNFKIDYQNHKGKWRRMDAECFRKNQVTTSSVFYHAWVGVRDIVLDYIQPTALRLPLLALIAFILIAITLRVTLTMATHFTVGA